MRVSWQLGASYATNRLQTNAATRGSFSAREFHNPSSVRILGATLVRLPTFGPQARMGHRMVANLRLVIYAAM